MNNNLFNYATSELSQDAFICWLLSYAVKGCDKDFVLSECAREFIRSFIPELANKPVWLSCPPQKQYKSIDVLLTVNDEYKVVVEDKTHSSDHDNQLVRYRQTIENDFPEYKCVGVYYKIGFQSDMKNVYEAGYVVFGIEKILAVMGKYIKENTNNIFEDYYDYLNSFYTRTALFKTRPVNEWDWEQICGFYNYCRETLTDTGFNFDFGYVNNPSGGFHGMWIWKPVFVNANGLKCEVYLQCEYIDSELRICYRASNDNEKIMGATRDLMIWKEERGKRVKITEKYNFKEPQRYGAGKSVALGVYKAKIKTFEDAVAAIRSAIADFKNLVTELPQI